eukprot:CAMPEP_0177507382 /NCGR_PEP_ID=MMETSP0369-20130122/40461_1 /TAXON_ID=447022 ORGANISM="Scrippsiella hangoei-like, Strain SHHI-4" /NCGR_SAMPLE_ID=MMETSP0369 /ASSEMBLY_ACC=CAM_ASM_000364 /LENGTH=170 /DNA_ID=CAMNT_0018985417 /DNA_START=11 /DNA_END=523 /DNA_ORIENTATION=+
MHYSAFIGREQHGVLQAPVRPTRLARLAAEGVVSKKPWCSFEEARVMAQWMGMSSKEEFLEYDCPGCYHVPKDPDVVYADQFVDWGDFLGLLLPFEQAREKARDLGLQTKEQYAEYVLEPQPLMPAIEKPFSSHAMGGKRTGLKTSTRLPWQPDLYYKEQWQGWEDWLGL